MRLTHLLNIGYFKMPLRTNNADELFLVLYGNIQQQHSKYVDYSQILNALFNISTAPF